MCQNVVVAKRPLRGAVRPIRSVHDRCPALRIRWRSEHPTAPLSQRHSAGRFCPQIGGYLDRVLDLGKFCWREFKVLAGVSNSLSGLREDDADLQQEVAANPLLCGSNCQSDIAIFAHVEEPGPLELLEI